MSEKEKMNNIGDKEWYVVQTYSGMEDAVKRNIENRIVSMNMQDYIFRVLIPERNVHYETRKNGTQVRVAERPFPSYICVEMIVTEESWHVVRNTPQVTGILGAGGGGELPVPLLDEEIIPILRMCGVEIEVNLDYKVGDTVMILAGSFEKQEAVVDSIDLENQQVTVLVQFFNDHIPQTLGLNEVKAIK